MISQLHAGIFLHILAHKLVIFQPFHINLTGNPLCVCVCVCMCVRKCVCVCFNYVTQHVLFYVVSFS